MLKLYTDAATKGNPGLSAAGILIIDHDLDEQLALPLPVATNHAAEFAAAIKGFERLVELGLTDRTVQFYCDSQIVVDSLMKEYAKHYAPQLARLLELCALFPMVIPVWQNDHRNRGAHTLALRGLKAQE